MKTIKWSSIPKSIRNTCWSSNCLPRDFDYDLTVEIVQVAPLYATLSLVDPETGINDFESCQVYQEDVSKEYTKKDLRHPIIIDRRFKGRQGNIADGLHRIMFAYINGIKEIPSVDVTEMFITAGYPTPTNICE